MPSKPESEQPAPAVGQVWCDRYGYDFLLESDEVDEGHGFLTLTAIDGVHREVKRVTDTDTYVGQFAGFKVEGE